jgi:succinyl-CoA synthetase beta subunit
VNVKIHEYQAKDILRRYGIPVHPGKVATTPEEAEVIARELGVPVVIKAQVYVGGRGKAGGIQFGDTPEEARDAARRVLGMDIKGLTVEKVLVTPKSDIREEYYAGIVLDRASQAPVVMVSAAGGVDIEQVAEEAPEKIVREPIDVRWGLLPMQARDIMARAGVPHTVVARGGAILSALARAYMGCDATLAEINPLALTSDGQVIAADAKILIDDNALPRQQEYASWAEPEEANPLEFEAKAEGLTYVKLDGDVGIIGNGAGLVMSTLDVVAYAGEQLKGEGGAGQSIRPANFLDIGGGASAEVMANGLEIVLSDPSVRSVFVNVFGGITACDAVANGIVSAVALLKERGEEVNHPIVVRLDGNKAAEGRAILQEANLPVVEQVDTMDGAARRAAELAAAAPVKGA